MPIEPSVKLAVLIDADNASADIIEPLLEEIAKYGVASVKRIYGDWSSGLKKWKDALLPHAITPIQQFAYTKGKNATDMAMVIDAMDLLYSDTFDGFCIVSSDSDFTRLASRIREKGLTVYGFGQKKTPESFRKACDKFIYTENLMQGSRHAITEMPENSDAYSETQKRQPETERTKNNGKKLPRVLLDLIGNAVKEHADDDGWASLGAVGQYINKVQSDFDSRNYGHSKLSSLINAVDLFETKLYGNHLWLREKSNNSKKAVLPAETANNKGQQKQKIQNTAVQNTANNTQTAENNKNGKQTKPKQEHRTAAKPTAVKTDNAAAQIASSGTRRFSILIPLIQDAVQANAKEDGWAAISEVSKYIETKNTSFDIRELGFDDIKQAIKAIYSEWIETKKAGRGVRVRVNKIYNNDKISVVEGANQS
ncbi:NYN domain-containing protein [Stenoxybacter acetivorans]|uniref:NYN domain-containing protein n=1 Tax=Stenoxybacter acetivorans TaxID=422441 RepID=UPI00056604A2|nr:NYN domain-containing protein [Stenoxybacter acetivorans]